MDSMELHRALRAHCQKEMADCTKCCLRLFCYTPPCEMTDGMMEDVISFAASQHSHTESQTHLCHCSDGRPMPCPCELDMSTALGYEHSRQGKKTMKLTEDMLPHHVGFTPLEWMQATSCHKEEPDGAEREAARDTPKEDLQTAHKTNI